MGWIRRHRVLVALLAGVGVTAVALVVVGWFVLADQRRTATVLAAALSRALAREVQIERVPELSPTRAVLSGVRLPAAGGWPADVAASQVDVAGPLLAAARGDTAPLRLVVAGATVTGVGGPTTVLTVPDGLRDRLGGFLAAGPVLDVTLSGGLFRPAPDATPVAFDLVLRKDRTEARAEIRVRAEGSREPPLVLTANARIRERDARIGVSGRGNLGAVGPWLPPASRPALRGRLLDLGLDADFDAAGVLRGRARLAVSDTLELATDGTVRGGLVELSAGRVEADLAWVGALAGLAAPVTGHASIGDLVARWRPEDEARPTVTASVSVPTVVLPAALLGTEMSGFGLSGRVSVQPAPGGLVVRGDLAAQRVRASGVDATAATARWQATLAPGGPLRRVELDGRATLEGARVAGGIVYDADRRRIDGRLGAEAVELASLVRALAPGWLAPADRLGATSLDVRLAGVDPVRLRAGTIDVFLQRAVLRRPDGDLSAGPVAGHARLGDGTASVTLDTSKVVASLAALRGAVARVTASAELERPAGGTAEPRRAQATVRDGANAILLEASLGPTPPGGPGRFRLTARLPALERLGDLWPDLPRRMTGTAALDATLAGPGLGALDGHLTLTVPEAEIGRISVRQLALDLPVRRGFEAAGAPAWGRLEVEEFIGQGVVVHDLATPARVWHDRLALNDLAYALYAGTGRGRAEVEWAKAGLSARGNVTGSGVRVEEFVSAYGIRGGTMTGLLRYDVDANYQAGRLTVQGRLDVPDGGTVSIQLLDRLFNYAAADPSGVIRRALENLRTFDYKAATASVRSAGDDIHVNLSLMGRERFGIFPPRVREINVREMPLSFLARQFPGQ